MFDNKIIIITTSYVGSRPDSSVSGRQSSNTPNEEVVQLKEDHSKEIDRLSKRLEEYKSENNSYENEKDELRTRNRQLESRIRDLELEAVVVQDDANKKSIKDIDYECSS